MTSARPAAGASPRHASRPDPVDARRAARFNAARTRISKIVAGSPPLTDEQRLQLALLLWPATREWPGPSGTAAQS